MNASPPNLAALTRELESLRRRNAQLEAQLQQVEAGHRRKEINGEVKNSARQQATEEELQRLLAHYHTLFEEIPTSLWEEDFSAVKTALNQLRAGGVTDLPAYLAQHPDDVHRLWASIKVVDLNQATLTLMEAGDKSVLLQGLAPLAGRPHLFNLFCRQLMAIDAGQTHFRGESASRTLKGKDLNIVVYWAVLPGYEATFERVLISVLDVTDLKQTEAALRAERALLEERVAQRTAELELARQQTEALYLVSRAILNNQEWADLIQITMTTMLATLPADSALFYLLDVEQRQVLDYAHITLNPAGRPIAASSFDRLWAGLTGWVIRNGKPALSLGEPPDPRESDVVQRARLSYGIGPLMVVALQYQDQVLGTLTVLRNRGAPDFTLAQLELLQVMADQLAVALTRTRLTESLRRQTEELARANRLKDEFLASMSHELRTPLNVILSNVEINLEGIYGPLTPKQQNSLKLIDGSAHHLLELISDILDLSKIGAGMLELNITTVFVEDICQASLDLVKEMARAKSIRLRRSLDFSLTTIHADSLRLKQILVNLLTNAIKFTPANGTVTLETGANLADNMIEFVVWDTGIGIKQEDLAAIFDPFVQLDGGLNRQEQGAGLGLALVQRLAALHNGAVVVASTPGQGTRFTVSLPVDHYQKEPSRKQDMDAN